MKSDNVSACVIIRNAADTLTRFTKWIVSRFNHIVIVTSNSEDNTVEIIKQLKKEYPNQITHKHKEMENFASQKQFALDQASTEWKLIVDADEIMEDIDWDNLVKKLTYKKINLIWFPRYNLQKDEKHYHYPSYPDIQARLMNSEVKFNLSTPVHEQVRAEYLREEIKKDTHIIHWGHLRDEENQLVKSNMRQKFAIWDRADGSNLLKYNNWYNRRNELWDTQVKPLPNQIQQFIKTV